MKSIACVLLLVAAVSGQSARHATIQTRPSVGAAAAGGAAAAKSVAAAPATANAAPAAAAAPAAPAFGPAFFGPGVNNLAARRPLTALLNRANEVAASDPNVRVFVDLDGTIEFTDQFGREVEVLDAFGRDALDLPGLEEQIELQQQQFQLERRRAQLMAELATLNRFSGTAAGGAAAGAAAAAAPAPARRFSIVP